MFLFVLKKLFYGLMTLWGVATVIFFLFNALPSDPSQMMIGQNESLEQLTIVRKKYGFDYPLWTQYVYYLNDLSPLSVNSLVEGDFTYLDEHKYTYVSLYQSGNYKFILKYPYLRESFQNKGAVSSVIADTLPNTLLLAGVSIVFALFIGMGLGIIAALSRSSWVRRVVLFIGTLGISVPSFFAAILFSWLFGFLLYQYTGLPMTGSLYEVDDLGSEVFVQWKNLILPAIVLGIRPLAVVSQLTYDALSQILHSDYIRTARAKGLSETAIVFKHALRNALNPIITTMSGWFAGMLTGAVFVEYIFGWNGLGKQLVVAIDMQDLPLIIGIVLTIAAIFVFMNHFLDVAYAYLDPRMRTMDSD